MSDVEFDIGNHEYWCSSLRNDGSGDFGKCNCKPATTKPCSPCGDGDTEQQYHVHDTGSGEPHDELVEEYCAEVESEHTPPTSTVTLDRADFDKAILRLERMRKALSPHAGIDNGMFDECAAIVALLRAAEK